MFENFYLFLAGAFSKYIFNHLGARNSEHRTQSTEHRARNTEYRTRNIKSKLLLSEVEMQQLDIDETPPLQFSG